MGILAAVKTALGRRGLGYLQDKEDSRDRRFDSLPLAVSVPPPSVMHRNHIVSVLDQGGTNSCVGYSTAQALRVGLALDGIFQPEQPSPYAIYYWARAETRSQNSDAGTFIRDAARGLQKFGFPPESKWPSKPTNINKGPDVSAYRAAHDKRGLRGYYRIAMGDLNSMRLALAAGKPFVFGITISSSFTDNKGPNTIDIDSGRILGGHAMCCIGYDPDRFLIVNSWGNSWRDRGLVWVTAGRMQEAVDIWVMDFDPNKPST